MAKKKAAKKTKNSSSAKHRCRGKCVYIWKDGRWNLVHSSCEPCSNCECRTPPIPKTTPSDGDARVVRCVPPAGCVWVWRGGKKDDWHLVHNEYHCRCQKPSKPPFPIPYGSIAKTDCR